MRNAYLSYLYQASHAHTLSGAKRAAAVELSAPASLSCTSHAARLGAMGMRAKVGCLQGKAKRERERETGRGKRRREGQEQGEEEEEEESTPLFRARPRTHVPAALSPTCGVLLATEPQS